jgi:hypothetical protein
MECPICFTDNCDIKLNCNHHFHNSCLKTWYLKGDSGNTCPMCRKNICFRGMYKIIPNWIEERDDSLYDRDWCQAVEELCTYYDEILDEFSDDQTMFKYIISNLFEDILDQESKLTKCKSTFVYVPDFYQGVLDGEFDIDENTSLYIIDEPKFICIKGKTHNHILRNMSHYSLPSLTETCSIFDNQYLTKK